MKKNVPLLMMASNPTFFFFFFFFFLYMHDSFVFYKFSTSSTTSTTYSFPIFSRQRGDFGVVIGLGPSNAPLAVRMGLNEKFQSPRQVGTEHTK
jgi:hypothetical protein